MINNNFNAISKKNNQSSVSNADRETPTSFPALFADPRVGISRSASETDDWLFFLPILVNFYKSFVCYLLKTLCDG